METLRDRMIAALKERTHMPVVIIGAGINGVGTFRDLCLQGVDCLIVDRGDFCAGASRAPSRMIHGGLKYLETGEFRLVSEAARERNRLLKNAAHLVRPLELVIPLHSWFGGMATSIKRFLGQPAKFVRRGALIVLAGLNLYDFYGRLDRVMPLHRMISRKNILADIPDLTPSVKVAACYYDAWIASPERLTVELLRDGLAANPRSIALNHLAFTGLEQGKLVIVDQLTRDRFELTADIVVNATGAWIDDVNSKLSPEKRLIGGNKGSHLILDLPDLARVLRGRMIYFETEDARLCLVSDYMGKVLLGTTDIPIGNPDEAVCTDDEVDYLFATFRHVFPSIPISRKDIQFSYCGVRPLPFTHSADPGAVSRDHSLDTHEPSGDRSFPIFSLIGGKWTTFRAFAEQATDRVLLRLGKARKVTTEHLAIGGGAGMAQGAATALSFVAKLKELGSFSTERCEELLSRYGSNAVELAKHLANAGDQKLHSLPDYSREEIAYVARREMVTGSADFILGRTWIAFERRVEFAHVEEVSDVLGEALGWDADQRAQDIENTIAYFRTRHRIDLRSASFAEATT